MTRTLDFRYYAVRDGAEFCELHAVTGSEPKITMDDGGEIKTKLSGSFLPPTEAVNWLTDGIKPVMIVDGVKHPLGLFLPSRIDLTDDGTSSRISVDAYDQGWVVRDHRTEHLLFFQAGTNYINAVSSLITECGISVISAVPTEETLTEDREDWEIGTSSLEIINSLLSEINYKNLWFDASGTAILEPKATPTADNINHVLDESNIESLMLPGLASSTDFYSKPNVFLCICSNADKESGMVALAENTNPQSPLSIARRGRRITKVERINNIASQEELQMYADRMVMDSLMKGEVLRVSTCLLPGFGVGDVVALRYGETSSICTESSWSMELKIGGIMEHTLDRVVMNLD